MKIQLKISPRGQVNSIEVQKGTTIEALVQTMEKELPYTILAAKLGNKIVGLTDPIEEETTLTLLDMRTQSANLIYQYSLSLLYLKAIEDILGKVGVEIQNSLNKGLYTEVKSFTPVTKEQVCEIEERMRQLVAADLPFVRQMASREEALEMLVEDGYKEKTRLLLSSEVKQVKFYYLEGHRDFFYGLMVPSTRYLKYFELKKYRHGILLRFPYSSAPDKMPAYVDEKKLYNAFGEAKKWCQLMGVSFVSDLNEKVKNGGYKELVLLSEALQDKKIVEIAEAITKQKKRIVLIAGPSSSGKTTFARRLCIQLKVNGLNPLYMGTDDYFVERSFTPLDEHGEPDFENLGALDVNLFNENMNGLLSGKEVDLPVFDFMEGTKRYGKRLTTIKPNQPIVIEGIHALNKGLTEYIPDEEKFKIYISPLTQLNIDDHNRIPTTDARMLRRMVRDYLYRGHTAQSTINAWPKVRAGEDKNIFPFSSEADVLFNSAHIYELAVLKKHASPLLAQIKPEEPEYSEAVRMLKFLRFFEAIEDDSIIANNSIIREFIGGSIFVD